MKNRVDKISKEKNIKGGTYFSLAMLCFLGLGLDGLLIFVDYLIFGEAARAGFSHYTWYMHVTHWGMVVVVWSSIVWYTCKKLSKKEKLAEVFNVSLSKKQVINIGIALVVSIVFTCLEQLLDAGTLPQIVREYTSFSKEFGNKALLMSIFQNVYYVFEVALVVLLLALMQKAGEEWFKNKRIPYCAVGLTFTWGLGHISHGGLAALWVMAFSAAVGLFFVLLKKNVWATYFMILFIFII